METAEVKELRDSGIIGLKDYYLARMFHELLIPQYPRSLISQ